MSYCNPKEFWFVYSANIYLLIYSTDVYLYYEWGLGTILDVGDTVWKKDGQGPWSHGVYVLVEQAASRHRNTQIR